MPIDPITRMRADELGIPDYDDVAEPGASRHEQSYCINCGKEIFTNKLISPAGTKQDPWKHLTTNRQGCCHS